jgi:hypothetical protein
MGLGPIIPIDTTDPLAPEIMPEIEEEGEPEELPDAPEEGEIKSSNCTAPSLTLPQRGREQMPPPGGRGFTGRVDGL